MNIRCLAFDLGRVIFDFDYQQSLEKMSGNLALARNQALAASFYEQYGLAFEKGSISSREFYSLFKKVFQIKVSYAEFVPLWCDIFSPNRKVIGLVEKLSRIYPVYLISNINKLHYEFLYKNYEQVFSFFQGLVLSYKVRAVKPEKKIYDHLVFLSGISPRHTVYVDDRPDLIEAARKLDFVSLQFAGFDRLLSDLGSLGIAG